MTLPAGKWWIGDLCYVLHSEWDEFCNLTLTREGCLDGEFNLSDGRRFAVYSTLYGDGEYDGLSVDAGLIGCILLSDIDQTNSENDISLGRIVEFDKPFETGSDESGVITFGHIQINTGDYSDVDADDNYDADEEYDPDDEEFYGDGDPDEYSKD